MSYDTKYVRMFVESFPRMSQSKKQYWFDNQETLKKFMEFLLFTDFTKVFINGMPGISAETRRGWVENPKALRKFLRELSPPKNGDRREIQKNAK